MWPFNNLVFCIKKLLTSHIGALVCFVLMLYMVKSGTLRRVMRRVCSAVLSIRGRTGPLSLSLGDSLQLDGARAAWELRKDGVGVYSIQGRRPHMEDRFNVIELDQVNSSVFGVFDGHGGQFAVDFTEKTLSKALMGRLLSTSSLDTEVEIQQPSLSSMLTEEILQVDRQLVDIQTSTDELSGTTAIVAVLRGTDLAVANVGDSRAVMYTVDGKVVPLSYDHKPDNEKERTRINNAGGFVAFNGVWRVVGVLAMSRALGDFPLKENSIVIADPDVLTFDLSGDLHPSFMILATDGLWDVFDNDEACLYVRNRLNEPHLGARSLAMAAYQRGSLDNITVMVVNFEKRLDPRMPARRESFA